MPLTRSAASGNKNPVINIQDTKKAKAKPSKRAANEKEVDVPPRKTNKKATDASNGTANKKGKKEPASKKQVSKDESDDKAEEPEQEESDDALVDAKAETSKRVAKEKKVDAPPKKTNKKATDTSNGTANKKGKKEPASKKQASKHESDEDAEEPELEEADDALIDAKAKPKKSNKKATTDDSNGTANKKGNKEPASKKQALKDESDEDTEEPELEETDEGLIDAKTIYEFTAKDIKGNEVSLDKYKGHVCVIVNVASKCGHTKSNYEQFVEIFNKYSEEKGLKILAFPCNQFGKQEPGDNEKICEFVEKRNVKFDMFDKIDVNGKNAHPLWKFLTSKITGPKGKNVDWNFTKFVIDKEGQVVERHSSAMKPLKLVENLEKYW